MNKRILSFVLMLCMVFALFAGLTPAEAFADGSSDTMNYTVQQGDILINICKHFGLNYYSVKDVIMKLNGFTSESSLNNLKPRQVIILPVSDAAAATLSGAASATSVGTSSGTTINGDTVAYYLIAHTMQRGDTLATVCAAYGVNYSSVSEQVLSLNNIKYTNRIPTGKVVYIPVNTAPSTGSALRVMKHQVASGDTMYDLCNTYGMSYNKNLDLVTGLNKGTNLSSIKAGAYVYVPATGAAAGGGSEGGAGTGAGGTGSGTGTGTEGTATTGTKYKITISTVTNGTVVTKVGGSQVTEAAAGSTVTVVATGADGYAQKGIRVTYNDGTATLPVNNNQFTMPKANVTVMVTFDGAKKITKASTTNGSFDVLVNGASATTAVYGKTITVSCSPANGYGVDTVSYIVGGTTYTVSKGSNGYSFTMPDKDVKVKVTFKKVATYVITSEVKGGEGSVLFQVDGDTIKQAAEGLNVSVEVIPATGYKLKSVTIQTSKTDTTVLSYYNANTGTFKMPASAVYVVVELEKEMATYKIYAGQLSHGTVKFMNIETGKYVTSAKEGDIIQIVSIGDKGYTQDFTKTPDVRWKDTSTAVTVGTMSNSAGKSYDYCFKMPGANVVVYTYFVKGGHLIYKNSPDNGTLITTVNSVDVYRAAKGDTVKIVFTAAKNYTLMSGYPKVYLCDDNGKKTSQTVAVNTNYEFTMPDQAVYVEVKFTFQLETTFAVNIGSISNGSAEVYNGTGVCDNAAQGTKLTIKLKPNDGYELDSVNVVTASNTVMQATAAEIDAGVKSLSFTMPGEPVWVYVTYKETTPPLVVPEKFTLSVNSPALGTIAVSPAGTQFEAGTEITVTLTVKSGTKATVGKCTVDDDELAAIGYAGTSATYKFTMPEHNVTLKGTFVKDKFTVTKQSPTNGDFIVVVDGDDVTGKKVAWGKEITIQITPAEGYQIKEVKYNDGSDHTVIPDNGVYHFTMPEKDVAVTVSFEAVP